MFIDYTNVTYDSHITSSVSLYYPYEYVMTTLPTHMFILWCDHTLPTICDQPQVHFTLQPNLTYPQFHLLHDQTLPVHHYSRLYLTHPCVHLSCAYTLPIHKSVYFVTIPYPPISQFYFTTTPYLLTHQFISCPHLYLSVKLVTTHMSFLTHSYIYLTCPSSSRPHLTYSQIHLRHKHTLPTQKSNHTLPIHSVTTTHP